MQLLVNLLPLLKQPTIMLQMENSEKLTSALIIGSIIQNQPILTSSAKLRSILPRTKIILISSLTTLLRLVFSNSPVKTLLMLPSILTTPLITLLVSQNMISVMLTLSVRIHYSKSLLTTSFLSRPQIISTVPKVTAS